MQSKLLQLFTTQWAVSKSILRLKFLQKKELQYQVFMQLVKLQVVFTVQTALAVTLLQTSVSLVRLQLIQHLHTLESKLTM